MSSPLITIAMPVHNVENYIEASLTSALEQDFTFPYEVLVIDDHGTDMSMEKVEKIKRTHSRGDLIRIWKHDKNKGLGPARNTAIEEAKGKYLLFLDSDDTLTPSCLSALYRPIIEKKTDYEIVVGSYQSIDSASGTIIVTKKNKESYISHPNAGVYLFQKGKAPQLSVWNKLYNLNFLRINGIHCLHRIFEDNVFSFKAAIVATNVAVLPQITYNYTVNRQGSIIDTITTKKQGTQESAETCCDIIQNYIKLLEENKHVPCMHDFYFDRMVGCLNRINNSSYTEEQVQYIKQHTTGFLHCIGNPLNLSRWDFRAVYAITRAVGEDFTTFLKIKNFFLRLKQRI